MLQIRAIISSIAATKLCLCASACVFQIAIVPEVLVLELPRSAFELVLAKGDLVDPLFSKCTR